MSLPRITLITIATLALLAPPAQAGTIDLIVNAYATYDTGDVVPITTKVGDLNPTPLVGWPIITYEIAVRVVDDGSNMGLATIVFDVLNAGACSGYQMPHLTAAESGFAQLPPPLGIGPLHYVTDSMYVDSGTTAYAGYNGGWGFDNAGLPIGGNTTSQLCDVLGAGALTPLTWTADVNPTYPGLQPYARLGVGHGTYTFPPDDPALGGMQGGFGQDLPNDLGDGHWLMFRGTIDTSFWPFDLYGWNIVPTNGAVYSPTIDYNQDQGGGFRIAVSAGDMTGDSFACYIAVPEPLILPLVLLGAAAMIRRPKVT